MTDHFDTIASFFHSHIEHTSLSVDAIADVVSVAAANATSAIFDEGKIIVCGVGIDAAGATLFVDLLRHGLLRDRPVLPAVLLTTHSSEPAEGAINWVTGQLTALGQPGDMVFIYASKLNRVDAGKLGAAINRRQMASCWIGAQGPGLSLVFPGADISTTLALSHTSTIVLSELIETNIFGPIEKES